MSIRIFVPIRSGTDNSQLKLIKNPRRSRLKPENLNLCVRVKLSALRVGDYNAAQSAKMWCEMKDRREI